MIFPATACAACLLTTMARCIDCLFCLDFKQVDFNPLIMRRATIWHVLRNWERDWPGKPIPEAWLQKEG